MIRICEGLNLITGLVTGVFLIYGVIVSFREREYRAAGKLMALAVLLPAVYITVSLFAFSFSGPANIILCVTTIFVAGVLFFPDRGKTGTPSVPLRNVDERDTMFSRNELKPGTARYREYYQNKPEQLASDLKFRGKPGLLQKGTTQYHPGYFAAAQASFDAVRPLWSLVDGPVNAPETRQDPEKMTAFIREWAKKLGAADCGIARLKPYHLYTVGGRGDRYGKPVVNGHPLAIAITVEMDKSMIDPAPKASVVMESAQKYMEAGSIAVQIARFIRNSGYEARAHIDGNYEVICPLVARDAGLGEIGRMGLLMTPKQGPRVRISVVTTNMPLIPAANTAFMGVEHFCRLCKKCALSCPSNAIPMGEKTETDGVRRWKIHAESCFNLWWSLGTDCGRCIAVCPYAHPDNFFHGFIRWGISNSKRFARLAVIGDDFLYGKLPRPAPLPRWMKLNFKTNRP